MGAAYSMEAGSCEPFAAAHEQAAAMEQHLRSADAMAQTHSELETFIEREGRELQRRLLQAHLELRAARERPVEVQAADGVRRSYRRPSGRPLGTLFGTVEVARLAYQGPSVEGLHPLDATLNLPEELYSHGLRRLIAEHAARSSYEEVQAIVGERTGKPVGKRQLEELSIRAARDFEAFYESRTTEAEEGRELLVMSFDGAGIIMRPEDLRPATQKAAAQATRKLATRLTRGEKRNRKRMAEVAAIYSVAPFPRSVTDVMHDLRPVRGVKRKRPRPKNKRVSASVVDDANEVISRTFDEARRRDPEQLRCWVALVDGNRDQIAAIQKQAKGHRVELTLVLDLMHVLEYLWKAAYAFEPEGSKEAEAWVDQRLLGLLSGQSAGYLARGMRRNARARGLSDKESAPVEACANYLVNNSKLLHYDRALRDGLPIATGVIEGACRYLVRDRMDRTGARWSLDGAESVLRLRALWTNGDFDAYWAFHLDREHQRTHRSRYADGRVPYPLAPSKTTLKAVN
jgi:hypothetical protein